MAIRTLFIFLFLFPAVAMAELADRRGAPYAVTRTSYDPALKKSEAVFALNFYRSGGEAIQDEIRFSYNGIERKIRPDAQGKFLLKTRPGRYKFKFYYNEKYREIFTESIDIKAAHIAEVKVYFEPSGPEPMIVDKPVLYVYPKNTTEVKISLEVKGHLSFSYPPYGNGWIFIADPDGTLHFGDKKFNYLFWDGALPFNADKVNWEEGFAVETKNLLSFLETQLSRMGFNTKESQDFITYWYPRMSVNAANYVHFMFNEDCDDYAKMTVDPRPDHIFRVYMLWSKIDGLKNTHLKEQIIPKFTREGFSLLEWGGSEIKLNLNDVL